MPGTPPIKLKLKQDGYINTERISHVKYDKKETVIWSIQSGGPDSLKIDSFNIITKSGADIFSTAPYKNGNDWIAVIKEDAADNAEFNYAIEYWNRGNSKTWDPIIAIRPSSFLPIPMIILIILGMAALAFFGFKTFRGNNSK